MGSKNISNNIPSNMNSLLSKNACEVIKKLYNIDFTGGTVRLATDAISIVHPSEPYVISFSSLEETDKAAKMGSLIWADDVKQFGNTIAEAKPSLSGKLMEEVVIEKRRFYASLFYIPHGKKQTLSDVTPMFLISVGNLLGAIHSVSTNQNKEGIRFKLHDMRGYVNELGLRVFSKYSGSDIMLKIGDILSRIETMEQTDENFGVCHGDFQLSSIISEYNNIWIYDFSKAVYFNYMYDVASFITSVLSAGFKPDLMSRQIVNEELLSWIKIGYGFNKTYNESYWENIELFMSLRLILQYMSLCDKDNKATLKAMNIDFFYIKTVLEEAVMADDIYKSLDIIRRMNVAAMSDTESITI